MVMVMLMVIIDMLTKEGLPQECVRDTRTCACHQGTLHVSAAVALQADLHGMHVPACGWMRCLPDVYISLPPYYIHPTTCTIMCRNWSACALSSMQSFHHACL